jgi:hypothetical protein
MKLIKLLCCYILFTYTFTIKVLVHVFNSTDDLEKNSKEICKVFPSGKNVQTINLTNSFECQTDKSILATYPYNLCEQTAFVSNSGFAYEQGLVLYYGSTNFLVNQVNVATYVSGPNSNYLWCTYTGDQGLIKATYKHVRKLRKLK